jgi:hypothetical protein
MRLLDPVRVLELSSSGFPPLAIFTSLLAVIQPFPDPFLSQQYYSLFLLFTQSSVPIP